MKVPEPSIRVFTTCPQSKDGASESFAARVAEVAAWSEDAGFHGILVYTDNSLVDPWLVAQLILQETRSLSPLVAVQPVYMHPYTAAKMIASLAFLHGRRLDVNLVAGGFRKDLLALADETPHDDRYERLVEYGAVVRGLLTAPRPYSFEGRYYAVRNLALRPAVPPALMPGFFVSGSSPAGLAAARSLGATAVKYPQPAHEERSASDPQGEPVGLGIRMGIVARETDEEAWAVAHERFPGDRKGQLTHRLAMEVTDSHWHRQLSRREAADGRNGSTPSEDPYWLWPFQNYKTFCPYLVGSHERVARELRGYRDSGFTNLIVDIPVSPEDLGHIGIALERTLARVGT